MTENDEIMMKNPIQSGGFIRNKIFEHLGLSVTEAALALGVTRPALSAILNERVLLSPDMSIRIENVFGLKLETMMRIQNAYDILQARRRAPSINVKPFREKSS